MTLFHLNSHTQTMPWPTTRCHLLITNHPNKHPINKELNLAKMQSAFGSPVSPILMIDFSNYRQDTLTSMQSRMVTNISSTAPFP